MLKHRWFTCVCCVSVLTSTAYAQSGLSEAILALPSTTSGTARLVNGRLFGSQVAATITDVDGSQPFGPTDRIVFTIAPRTGNQPSLSFTGGPRSQGAGQTFEAWVNDHREELLRLLFPASLAATVLGRDAAELNAQGLLLTTVLSLDNVAGTREGNAQGTRERTRFGSGGAIEFESGQPQGRLQGDSMWAMQGLYGLTRTLSVQGRFARQREDVTTNGIDVSVDYHPFVEINRMVRWRVGGTARSGVVYASSKSSSSDAHAMSLGTLDFDGGGWVSVFKDLRKWRVAGGSIVQGSKSHVPSAKGLEFLADAINSRGVQYDLSYGASVGVDTSTKTVVLAKYLGNRTLSSHLERPDSRLFQAGIAYRLGVPTVNFGYTFYSRTAFRSHGIFFQGNYNW